MKLPFDHYKGAHLFAAADLDTDERRVEDLTTDHQLQSLSCVNCILGVELTAVEICLASMAEGPPRCTETEDSSPAVEMEDVRRPSKERSSMKEERSNGSGS